MLLKTRMEKMQYLLSWMKHWKGLSWPYLLLLDVDRFPAKYPCVDHLVDCAQGQHQHTCQTELQLVPELLFLVFLHQRSAFPPHTFDPGTVLPCLLVPVVFPKCHAPNYLQLLLLCLNSFRLFNARYYCIPYIVSQFGTNNIYILTICVIKTVFS